MSVEERHLLNKIRFFEDMLLRSKEFEDIGGKISKFFCPVCKKDRYITWSDLRKKTVYEGENTQ